MRCEGGSVVVVCGGVGAGRGGGGAALQAVTDSGAVASVIGARSARVKAAIGRARGLAASEQLVHSRVGLHHPQRWHAQVCRLHTWCCCAGGGVSGGGVSGDTDAGALLCIRRGWHALRLLLLLLSVSALCRDGRVGCCHVSELRDAWAADAWTWALRRWGGVCVRNMR